MHPIILAQCFQDLVVVMLLLLRKNRLKEP